VKDEDEDDAFEADPRGTSAQRPQAGRDDDGDVAADDDEVPEPGDDGERAGGRTRAAVGGDMPPSKRSRAVNRAPAEFADEDLVRWLLRGGPRGGATAEAARGGAADGAAPAMDSDGTAVRRMTAAARGATAELLRLFVRDAFNCVVCARARLGN